MKNLFEEVDEVQVINDGQENFVYFVFGKICIRVDYNLGIETYTYNSYTACFA